MESIDPGTAGHKTNGPLLPKRLVAARYGVNIRTIERWVESPTLGFARPVSINGRWYFHEKQLEAFEIRRAANKETA
jgi:hypothetical protein